MIVDFLTRIDKKYAITIITGLAFGILSIYTDFFRNNKPKVQFDILSNTEVLSIKENINKIQITYDSINVLTNKQNLSIITLKVYNNGNADILKNYYDDKFPLGFIVPEGKILEMPTIIYTNSNFLKSSVVSRKVGVNRIYFNDFIFEEGDFFVIKILVLNKDGKLATIVPTGRIAGVKGIDLVESLANQKSNSFWDDVQQTSIITHLKRIFFYIFILPVGSMLALIIVVAPIALIAGYFDKRNRRKKVKLLKYQLYRELDEEEKFIADRYVESGTDTIQGLINADLDDKLFRILLLSQMHQYNLVNENKLLGVMSQIYSEDIEIVADGENSDVTVRTYNREYIRERQRIKGAGGQIQDEKISLYANVAEVIIKLLSTSRVSIAGNKLHIEDRLDSFIKKMLWVANN